MVRAPHLDFGLTLGRRPKGGVRGYAIADADPVNGAMISVPSDVRVWLATGVMIVPIGRWVGGPLAALTFAAPLRPGTAAVRTDVEPRESQRAQNAQPHRDVAENRPPLMSSTDPVRRGRCVLGRGDTPP